MPATPEQRPEIYVSISPKHFRGAADYLNLAAFMSSMKQAADLCLPDDFSIKLELPNSESGESMEILTGSDLAKLARPDN